MAQWLTYSDVASRWIGGDLPVDQTQIEVLLDDAEDAMLRAVPGLPDQVTAGEVPVARVKKVGARMVIRYLQNPEGVSSRSQVAGSFTENVSYSGAANLEGVYLTDQDLAELGGLAGRAFTVNTIPQPYLPVTVDLWGDPL